MERKITIEEHVLYKRGLPDENVKSKFAGGLFACRRKRC